MMSKNNQGTTIYQHDKNDQVKDILEFYFKINNYCEFLTRNKWDGEDLAQESICKALSQYGQMETLNVALLKKIAYHTWIDAVRKKSFENLSECTPKWDSLSTRTTDYLTTVDELVSKSTPKQAIAYALKEAFKYKNSEIADLMELSETAVKGLLSRTRENMKGRFREDNKEKYWNDPFYEDLIDILGESIHANDSTLLITFIPKFLSHNNKVYIIFQKKSFSRSYSPSLTSLKLCA
ncbi:sigma factor-like helix-turn-helix DNA-binding protein [Sutcliffiella cohnii]|uniref:sigma factor-like helix-turn-helix DNA-binding protein n=1 Tax=Sutcliffiella cohnii TaxID=33932 RepID=UPI002E1DC344|nr:sigma factor-like helix-turn-helix DNA-binding protein [Sutcliffiella cohnii]MED4017024.1 hypothetical protein [Sutcliffiella cohnii]